MESESYELSSVHGDGYEVSATGSNSADHDSSSNHDSKNGPGENQTRKEKSTVEIIREEKRITKRLDRSANEALIEVAIAVFMLTVFVGAVVYYVFLGRARPKEGDLAADVHRADLQLFSTESQNESESITGAPSYPKRQCTGPSVICGRNLLLCTYSASASPLTWMAVPPKNFCSVIFYEALGYEGRDKLGNTPRSDRFNYFLSLAQQRSPWPEFGVAFDYKYVMEASHLVKTPSGTRALTDLYRFNVVHFGVLNAGTFPEYTTDHIKATLDLFTTLRRIQKKKADEACSLPGGIVYGVKLMPPRTGNEFQLIDNIIRGSNVDWLIATTHLSGPDENDASCRITAPTTWDQKFADYDLPMKPTIKFLQSQGYLDLGIPVSVSFSLRGRWYKPLHTGTQEDFKPGKPCIPTDQDNFLRYSQVCKNPAYLKNADDVETDYFRYTYDQEKGLTYVFEDYGGIGRKVAFTMRANLGFNFAVFDVDFEYLTNGCLEYEDGYAAFDRLKMVCNLQRYYRRTYGGNATTASTA